MALTQSNFNKLGEPPKKVCAFSVFPSLCQVKAFWKLLFCDDLAAMPGKVSRHADAWGVRKMLSHIFRQMRLARQPRDPRLLTHVTPISALLGKSPTILTAEG